MSTKGYYEVNKSADFFGLPATIMSINVIYNGPHWHDHAELLYSVAGDLCVKIEGQSFHLPKDGFLYINPGKTHEICDGAEGNLQIICSIDPDIFRNMEGKEILCQSTTESSLPSKDHTLIRKALFSMAKLSLFSPADPFPGISYENPSAEPLLFDLLKQHPLQNEKNWYAYHSYLYQLLMVLSSYKTDAPQASVREKQSSTRACILYIHEHLSEELNAAVLAEHLHVSESTIYRIFSGQLGLHLNEYITTTRLNAACRYLSETDRKVADIAFACGFTGLSNFYRVFQAHLGISPKEYRHSHLPLGSQLNLNESDIMKLNRFENFYELPYSADIFSL